MHVVLGLLLKRVFFLIVSITDDSHHIASVEILKHSFEHYRPKYFEFVGTITEYYTFTWNGINELKMANRHTSAERQGKAPTSCIFCDSVPMLILIR